MVNKHLSLFFGLSFKKKLFVVILLIAAVIVISIFINNSNKRNGYIFARAERTSLTEVVSESGSIASDGNIFVYSPTNGSISEIYVENGEPVKKGQELFKVESSATDVEKQTAYASYLAAKAVLDADTAELYSLQSTMFGEWKTYTDIATNSTFENEDGSPKTENRILTEFTRAQDDWLAAEANYKNQQSVIAKDQASLNSAYTSYLATQTTVVKSPLEGIVSNLSYSIGNSVTARTALALSAKPVLVIKNSESLEAVIPVGQTNIVKVGIGQKVIINPDAYKDKKYTGRVVRIDSIGENTSGVVTYNVYATVEADKYLKPGMTFDSDIVTEKLEDVLTVPNSAVVLNKGIKSVRVVDRSGLKYIPVKTGIKGETRTQILSGISDGQEVVSSLTNIKAERPGFLGL